MEFADLDLNKLYSYTDYYKWKFEERVELIESHIFKMSPAPTSAHQAISRKIAGELWLFLKGNSCQVFSAPFDVRLLSKTDGAILTFVLPNICVVCAPSKIDRKASLGTPDIVIEILSPSNSEKELKNKYEVYEEYGIKAYWIVFPAEKTLLIYTLTNGKFVPSRLIVKGDMVSSSVLPGFVHDLTGVFPAHEFE